jgi:hypothetical protein
VLTFLARFTCLCLQARRIQQAANKKLSRSSLQFIADATNYRESENRKQKQNFYKHLEAILFSFESRIFTEDS